MKTKDYKTITFEGENTVNEVKDLMSDTSALKQFGTNKALTKKELTADNFKETGKTCLEMYYDRYHPFDQAITIGLEERMMIQLPEDKKMQGYIDRLDKIADGHFSVHDYKTSNRVPPQAKADQDRQLGLYASAVHQKYPEIKKIDLVWHYVRFDEEVRSSRTEQQLDIMVENTVNLIKDVETATELKNFPTKTSILCNWCEFKAQCPEYSHQYALFCVCFTQTFYLLLFFVVANFEGLRRSTNVIIFSKVFQDFKRTSYPLDTYEKPPLARGVWLGAAL